VPCNAGEFHLIQPNPPCTVDPFCGWGSLLASALAVCFVIVILLIIGGTSATVEAIGQGNWFVAILSGVIVLILAGYAWVRVRNRLTIWGMKARENSRH
jgi:ABC-type nickel/cobalt efflux system permease component RcnA